MEGIGVSAGSEKLEHRTSFLLNWGVRRRRVDGGGWGQRGGVVEKWWAERTEREGVEQEQD